MSFSALKRAARSRNGAVFSSYSCSCCQRPLDFAAQIFKVRQPRSDPSAPVGFEPLRLLGHFKGRRQRREIRPHAP